MMTYVYQNQETVVAPKVKDFWASITQEHTDQSVKNLVADTRSWWWVALDKFAVISTYLEYAQTSG